ncbi:MAG: arsenate reductase ArsC [Saccharospirillaceae bacterium]|nr:arsenate reductase ArsC [Pseudomonadales bacterium]NRB80645.1 arsenate reductase ArsC [Saccharospirillaceae bacterium]
MKFLFICTHNRCRSILSEAITNDLGQGRITAVSAGSAPVGEVHPLSLKYLTEKNISTKGLISQSWNEFEADQPDVVITVCDSAAAETCPIWFGNCAKVHWGLTDPSKLEGSDEEIKAAFFTVMHIIKTRTQAALKLDLENMSQIQQQAALNKIATEIN